MSGHDFLCGCGHNGWRHTGYSHSFACSAVNCECKVFLLDAEATAKAQMAARSCEGVKHDKDKAMWSLLPWPEIEEVVRVLTFGAKKYKRDNWRKVEDGERRYLDAALRHVSAIGRDEKDDEETGLSHYAHAIASLLFAFWHSKQEKVNRVQSNS